MRLPLGLHRPWPCPIISPSPCTRLPVGGLQPLGCHVFCPLRFSPLVICLLRLKSLLLLSVYVRVSSSVCRFACLPGCGLAFPHSLFFFFFFSRGNRALLVEIVGPHWNMSLHGFLLLHASLIASFLLLLLRLTELLLVSCVSQSSFAFLLSPLSFVGHRFRCSQSSPGTSSRRGSGSPGDSHNCSHAYLLSPSHHAYEDESICGVFRCTRLNLFAT